MRNLSTLSALHYVYGGLICLLAIFVWILLYAIGGMMNSELFPYDDVPAFFGVLLRSLAAGIGFAVLVFGVFVMLSGYWIANNRNRIGTMIIAGLCCLSFPFGTALGVFTLITLSDNDVKDRYAAIPPKPTESTIPVTA